MIERYSLPEMAAIWSEAHKLAVWKEVEVLARLDPALSPSASLGVNSVEGDGAVVAVRQGNLLATAFHPELTEDERFHRYFLGLFSVTT